MKNQTDMIVTIVAVLCMLIGVGVCYGTKGEALKPPVPETVVSAPLQLPAATVVMAPALPGASNSGGGGALSGGPAMGGRGGGPPSSPMAAGASGAGGGGKPGISMGKAG